MPHWPGRASHAAADEAVSPVIGMILVLAISVIGISGILYWGMPAVDEMKANVEAKSLQQQFTSLMADISELDAGTAGKTAKRWQPTLNRGELAIMGAAERWVVAMDVRADATVGGSANSNANKYNFTWGSFRDGDNEIWIQHLDLAGANNNIDSPDLDGTKVSLKVYKLDGTLATQQIISRSNAATSQPATLSADGDATWSRGERQVFYLRILNPAGPMRIDESAVRIEIWYDGKLVSQAWAMDMGKVHYALSAGLGTKELVATNGGLMQGTNGNFVIINSPPIPPPKESAGTYRLFARLVQITGSTSMAGGDRFDILVNLYGTTPLADYECTKPENCVKMVKVYTLGTYGPVWRSYYGNTGNGYKFDEHGAYSNAIPAGAAVDTEPFLLDFKQKGMSLTLIHSVLVASG